MLLGSFLIIFTGYTCYFKYGMDVKREVRPYFETVYLGLYPKIINSSNFYILASLVRKMIYAIVMIVLTSRPAGQIFILIVTQILIGGLLGSEKLYWFR